MKKIIKSMLPFIFSILISIPVIIPYFHKGYFLTHDGEWAVVRLSDMFRTLRDLQIPARYSGALNFGYGYPLFNFAYPFPYYHGVFIHFLGFGFVNSIKILFAGSVVFSAFFMFLAASTLWKKTSAGVISAILYVYLPYRMVDLYARGSIGESLSFVLFPLLFYLAIKLIEKPSYLWVSFAAISIGILITTHNIMSVLFLPVFAIFLISKIILKNKKEAIRPFVLSIILGLGISAFFWLPALIEKQYILLSKIPIADRSLYFVRLDQLFIPRWGYGVPTDPNGFSYQLGIPHLIVLVTTIFAFLFMIRHSGKPRSAGRIQNLSSQEVAAASDSGQARMTGFLLIAVSLVYIFLLFRPSAFIWEHLPILSEINYPWTTLGILGFLVSLLAGFLCRQKITKYIVICLSLISIVMYLPYAKPQYYVDRGDNYYLTNEATTTSSSELMPKWVKQKPVERYVEKVEKVEKVEGVGTINNISYNSKKITFNVLAKENMRVRVNTIYYPGWKAYVDNQVVPISYANERGLMDIPIPSGKHLVKASFGETPVRAISNSISLLSFFGLLFIGIKGLHKSPSV